MIKNLWHNFWYEPRGAGKLAPLLRHPLFWAMLCIKVLAGAMFASDYYSGLFIPFLDHFVNDPGHSPYDAFWNVGQTRNFPYPALMLYIMASPMLLLAHILPATWIAPLTLLIYRLPLLLADSIIAAVLVRWLRIKTTLVLWLYWCSPVLFYITYLHGQLDVIPIMLLFVSLHALFRRHLLLACVLLGLAIATKTHVLLAVPFFLFYLYRQDWRIAPLFIYTLAILAAFLLPNAPFLGDSGFMGMVFHNQEQQKLTLAAIHYGGANELYLIAALYLGLLYLAWQITIQNRDLFLMFLGFAFGMIVVLITPMPGWYYWILPFLIYFCARTGKWDAVPLFALLQTGYLLYFGLAPDSDYVHLFQFIAPHMAALPNFYHQLANAGLPAQGISNLAFTAMQTALLMNCLSLYRNGIIASKHQKMGARSFLLGISGDSGSGKTTLAEALIALFTPANMLAICGDDMHKWQRGHKKWQEHTHLDPTANMLHRELDYLSALRQRRPIYRRLYDHDTGKFTEEQRIKSTPIVALEGLHSFYLKPAQALFDLKLFLAPEPDLLLHRKIIRDVRNRNSTKEQVLEATQRRQKDSQKYIHAQESSADIVIRYQLSAPISEIGNSDINPETHLALCFLDAFYMDAILDDLAELLQANMQHYYTEDGHQMVIFHLPLAVADLEWLGEKHIPGLADLAVYAPHWYAGYDGILQLLIAYCVFYDIQSPVDA